MAGRRVIPKTIHQIWLGPRPVPVRWTESWRSMNPEFDYRMWGEAEIEQLGLRNSAQYQRYLAEEIYDGAADVARVEILHRFGGFYVDADSLAVRPLRDMDFLDADLVAVEEPSEDHPGLISNAFIGTTAGHPILTRYMESIGRVTELRPMWRLTGPGALTSILDEQGRDGVMLLPAWMFFATTLDGEPVVGGDAFGRHFWSTTAERWGRRGGTVYPSGGDP